MSKSANLLITINADSKQAIQSLKDAGYEVDSVTKKVKEQSYAQEQLSKATQKAQRDNQKYLTNTLSKYMSVAAAAALAVNGIRSMISAATERDEKYSTMLKNIDDVATNIRADLGGALLDAISPALESIYNWLVRIETKTSNLKNQTSYEGMLEGVWSGSGDYTIQELAGLKEYVKNDKYMQDSLDKNGYISINNPTSMLNPYHVNSKDAILLAIDDLINDKGGWSALKTETTPVSSSASTAVAATAKAPDYTSLFKNSTAYQVDQLNQEIANANALLFSGELSGLSEKEQEYVKEAIDSLTKQRDKLLEAPTGKTWVDSLTEGLNYAAYAIGTVSTSFADMWDTQADALEAEYEAEKESGDLTIEEEKKKQEEIERIRRKAFYAEKANSIAQTLISGAQSAIGFLSNPGGYAGIALAALAGTMTAVQVGTIAGQAYTPSYAQGAYDLPQDQLAQVHKGEMIIPRPFAEDIRNGNGIGGCTVNITIQGNANEQDIFNAIERAQRTGYLPNWSYT